MARLREMFSLTPPQSVASSSGESDIISSSNSDNPIFDINNDHSVTMITPGKIPALFESAFSFTKAELLRLIEGPKSFKSPKNKKESTNHNLTMQELKTALKTMVEEVDSLKEACCAVEDQYRDTTLKCTYDMKRSMGILFRLQQYTINVGYIKKENERLLRDKKYKCIILYIPYIKI